MSKFALRRLGLSDDPGTYRPNLQACMDVVLEQSDGVADDVLRGLKAALVPEAGKKAAASNDAATSKAIDALVSQTAAFKKSFATSLRQGVYGGESAAQSARLAMRFDDFQFLDANQLDANIELAQSLQTVMTSVEDVLPILNAMVSNLLGWSSVQAHLNPLRPDVFVHALRDSIEEFVPERERRATTVHLASGLMGVSLRHLYRETADWLRSQGVEPVHMTATKSTGLWNPTMAPDSTVARTMLTLDKLRRLLSGELDPNPLATDKLDFSSTIPVSMETLQDMRLVEPMMKRLADRASKAVGAMRNKASSAAPVVDMLTPQVDSGQRKKLGEQLGREVVLLMVENLLNDRRLLPPVRSSLQQLEPVLVKLARQDGRFFSERHHPARLFLDRITHRSLAFAAVDAPGYAHFQKSFDNAVSVLNGGSGDAAAFARILRKLDEAWTREDAEQHRRAGEAARGLLRAEQRNQVAQDLSRKYTERLQSEQVPDVIRDFLRGPWAQVVAAAQLNFSDGSLEPGGYENVVDDLIWSVQLRLTRQNRARLVRLVPEMLFTLRRGLELISYPPERMSVFFDALVSLHEQVFDNPELDDSVIPEEVVQDKSSKDGDEPWMVGNEAADSGFLDEDSILEELDVRAQRPSVGEERRQWRVENLMTGAWVDLALGGSWVRAQLTWTSPQRTLYMFISGGGMTHSMSTKTIEKMKKAGLIRIVSERRVMDNALDAVAQTALRNELLAAKPKADE